MLQPPLAYSLTFRCYGTWLHGDDRGSVDRHHNVYDTAFLPPNPRLEQHQRKAMKHPQVSLDARGRAVVASAITDTCSFRNWTLHAIEVRTNHIHVVISAGETVAEMALNAVKANATRVMRAEGCWDGAHSPWSTGGSTIYLWDALSLSQAIKYVQDGQGDPLPD